METRVAVRVYEVWARSIFFDIPETNLFCYECYDLTAIINEREEIKD